MVRKMSSSVGSAPDDVVRLLKAAVVKSRGCGLRKWYAALKLIEVAESAVIRPLPYLPWQPAHLVSNMALPRLSRSARGSLVGAARRRPGFPVPPIADGGP